MSTADGAQPAQHNDNHCSLPERGRRCAECRRVWLAIGFMSVLSRVCPWCGAAQPEPTEETA